MKPSLLNSIVHHKLKSKLHHFSGFHARPNSFAKRLATHCSACHHAQSSTRDQAPSLFSLSALANWWCSYWTTFAVGNLSLLMPVFTFSDIRHLCLMGYCYPCAVADIAAKTLAPQSCLKEYIAVSRNRRATMAPSCMCSGTKSMW